MLDMFTSQKGTVLSERYKKKKQAIELGNGGQFMQGTKTS